MGTLEKMRAQDLIRAVTDYCASPTEDELAESETWRAWNAAWERADEGVRRDALMILGMQLTEARRELHKSV